MADMMIRPARRSDLQVIAQLIRELADFERLADEVVFDEPTLDAYLFGDRPYAEVLIAEDTGSGASLGFALFFHSFSTFVGRPGLYLEDLLVRPAIGFYRSLGALPNHEWTTFRLHGESLTSLGAA